ncbi:hypothetical protein TNCV_2925491 [Trichonephila clavipes]|nr:hypothetical protein TNCV_2925491 [Trichonephila clavipes]
MLILTLTISSNSSWQKKEVVKIERTLYSKYLNPPDFFLFPRLKLALKGKRFYDIPDIQRNMTRPLNTIQKEDILQSFQDMHVGFKALGNINIFSDQ